MTHEQKPESAEFRTREEQIETMTVHYMEAGFPINAARRLARDGVAEAEDRGAVEQRRKDAEGAEPFLDAVIRILKTVGIDPLNGSDPVDQVADLEDRIADLKRSLMNIREAIELADPKVLVGTLWMPGQPETVVDYISAAIREGGEHG